VCSEPCVLTQPQWKWYWAKVYSAPRFNPSNFGTFTPSLYTLNPCPLLAMAMEEGTSS